MRPGAFFHTGIRRHSTRLTLLCCLRLCDSRSQKSCRDGHIVRNGQSHRSGELDGWGFRQMMLCCSALLLCVLNEHGESSLNASS